MSRALNVLFLCTGNSARSIMAEALLNARGAGRVRAFSAGSQPKGTVHPLALEQLKSRGLSRQGLRSKSWDEYAARGAPQMDVIVTVCDNAASEACPIWPGQPTTAHWGIPDPAAVTGSGAAAAFQTAYESLNARISRLIALPLEKLDPEALKLALREIGHSTP